MADPKTKTPTQISGQTIWNDTLKKWVAWDGSISGISGIPELVVTNAIDQTAHALGSSAFSATTNISNDYRLSRIEMNFSTALARTITVTTSDGTVLWKRENDTSLNISIDGEGQGFNASENLTVAATQTSGACAMDCVLTVEEGSATLGGNPSLAAGTEEIGTVITRREDNAESDAFGRLRVTNPITLFDSKNIFDDGGIASNAENMPLYFDNQQTSGSGTSTTYYPNEASQELAVSNLTAGTRVRQTKMRFNYQPGKSHLILKSFNLDGKVAGITKREGYFDTNNGIFLEASGTAMRIVRRTYATGSPVDNVVEQADWNIDPMDGTGASGITIDWTDTQILVIDLEWLGVGRVRVGFNIDGKIFYAHHLNNANSLAVPYMSMPNLPLRSEITNDGTGAAATLTQICATVISEGGSTELGSTRYVSTAGTHLDANVDNTVYGLIGLRLKSAYIGADIHLLIASIQLQTASSAVEWIIIRNPTVAGTPTWNDVSNSAIQYALGATANTITGGTQVSGGYSETGAPSTGRSNSATLGIDEALRLGSLIDGTVETVWLCVRPIGGSTNVDAEGSITWREVL